MHTHKIIGSFGSRHIIPIDDEVDSYETVLFTGTLEECKHMLF